jgi:uncharacterized protein (DUF3084 family)
MALGYVLILAVLILGGLIATLGDRIGTKVGKARLSLFNLRPKKTAVLVTIMTGVVISATTMGLLLLVSRGVRDRLLDFEKIRRGLRQDADKARGELQQASNDINQVKQELETARNERLRVKEQLDRINLSLKGALDRQRQTESLRQRVETQRNQIQAQFVRVSGQANVLRLDIGALRQERETLQRDRQMLLVQRNQIARQISQRDQEIARRNQLLARRDQDISTRDRVIATRETRLKELEQQQIYLQTELEQLAQLATQSAQLLRVGVPAIVINQNLGMALVQTNNFEQARQAVDVILAQANRVAIDRIQPPDATANTRIVQIEPAQVELLLQRITDGKPYVLRVVSSANYLKGEEFGDRRGVSVFIEVALNRTLFQSGAVIAAQRLDNPQQRSGEELQEWLTQLINEANIRARRKGLWAETSNVRFQAVQTIVDQLRQSDIPTEVRVIAASETPTAGPIKLEFELVQSGRVILRTQP